MERLSHRPAHPAARRLPGPARTENRLIAAREKLGLAVLAVERARRGTLARVRRSRLLLWRHRAPIADDLVLAPPDLRLQDPSFAEEVASGSMGLAGLTAALAGNSPFALHPPDPAWARELNGFGWLRHFAADRTLENEAVARRLVQDWIATTRRRNAHAWAPDIVGRRIISWLSHASLILDGAERRPYRAVMLSLEDQATYLSASWRNAPDGYPRLVALIGLTQAGLCIAGHERRLPAAEKCLAAELERQILADGGHVSRNPAVLLELLLDLLPLRQCFAARTRKPDEALTAAIQRMMPMLSRLRLGDGQLGRFNGMGITERDALATVLAYDTGGHVEHATGSTASGYVRLARGATVVLLDAGAAPPLALAGEACAGCLSFELSAGGSLLLVNAGAPGPAHGTLRASSRGTSCHNTLELGGQSSSKLVRARGLGTGASIQHPDHVTCGVGASTIPPAAASCSRHPTTATATASASSTPAPSPSTRPATGWRAATSSTAGTRASFASPGTCRSPCISICIRAPAPGWRTGTRPPCSFCPAASAGGSRHRAQRSLSRKARTSPMCEVRSRPSR